MPPGALPPALKHKFDTADANKERYKRATVRQSMVRRPSLAEHDPRAGHRPPASAKVAPK